MASKLPEYLTPAPAARKWPRCAWCGGQLGKLSPVYLVGGGLVASPLVGWHRPRAPEKCQGDPLRRRLVGGGLDFRQLGRLLVAIERRGRGRVERDWSGFEPPKPPPPGMLL